MKYFGDWSESRLKGLMEDFNITKKSLEGCTIIFAAYSYVNHSGSAFVLFEKDGKLFEVNGGHCSCYGLEGQWEPEQTSWKFLAQRKDIIEDYDYSPTTIEAVKKLVAKHQ